MNHLINDVMRTIDRMGTEEWALALGGLIIVGLICMRGFGSRSGY
jgi:hypothetical protein